jgi:protein O-GlcNAc transferase
MSGFNTHSVLQRAIEHHQAGRLAQAEELYQSILARDARCADALHLSGVIALQRGRGEAAADLIRRAILLTPKRADFHANLGEAYRILARLDDATASLRRALKLQPEFPVALNCLGVVLSAQHKVDEALTCYQKALRLAPNYTDAHQNLGNIFAARGQPEKAEVCFRQVLALRPDSADAYNCLGNALLTQHRCDEAIASYRHALVLSPDFAEVHNNLGSALCERGQLREAFVSIQQAIAIMPGFAAAHYNIGNVLARQSRLDEAVESFRRAIALKPDYAEAHNNLGGVFKERGQLDEALACYRQAVALDPTHRDAQSNTILTMLNRSDYDAESINAELRRWNRERAAPLAAAIKPHDNDRSPDRRLRIGYVSSDFNLHSVAFFVTALLEEHDREQFHVTCYSTNYRADEVTIRLQKSADEWRNCATWPDDHLAQHIREDEIDLLIDLSGHTSGNRLLVFARRPAPVQVAYLGFPSATGLDAIDYRLSDSWADPVDANSQCTFDHVVRLPDTAWCFTPLSGGPAVSAPTLAKSNPVFGCFNNFSKVTEHVLGLWARILTCLPGSRLVLKNRAVENASVVHRLQTFFAQRGISATRLEFLAHTLSPLDHLECYNRLDVALDTFPYHGTTTTCEALWMGVPVITLAGSTHVSRVGVSLLTNVGLPECVTQSPEEYVNAAVALASDHRRLTSIRTALREQMLASPLMDGPRLTRHVEAAYRSMWWKWIKNPVA